MVFPKKFFCYFKLESGGLILGWFSLVTFITQIVLITLYWNDFILLKPNNGDPDVFLKIMTSVAIVFILYNIFWIIMNILLLQGIFKKNYKFLIPWLVSYPIGLYIEMLIIFSISGILFIYSSTYMVSIVTYILFFVASGFKMYFWLCIMSLFRKLQNMKCEDRNYLEENI